MLKLGLLNLSKAPVEKVFEIEVLHLLGLQEEFILKKITPATNFLTITFSILKNDPIYFYI